MWWQSLPDCSRMGVSPAESKVVAADTAASTEAEWLEQLQLLFRPMKCRR